MSNRRKPKKETPRKKCQGECGKERAITFFFKVDSPMFPDGTINICRYCVREQVDVNDLEQVVGFLRQIDKPFDERYWNESLKSNNHPLGEYIRKVNSLNQFKGKTFDDSRSVNIGTTGDILSTESPDVVKSEKGEEI